MEKIKIGLADDQQLFRQGLAQLIRTTTDFELVIEAENGRIFLDELKKSQNLPDIALIDMHMPEMNGVELNEMLHKHYSAIKVIILSVYDQERFISKMIQAGASGYLTKNCETEELVTAVQTVYKSGFYFNNATLQAMRNASAHNNNSLLNFNNIPIDLTSREKEVLNLICKERTNAEIGAALFISPRTVEGHRNSLLIKAGCRNTAGLVVFAIKNGLFEVAL